MHEVDASIEYVDFLGRNRLEVNFEGEFGVYARATRWEVESLRRLECVDNTPRVLRVYNEGSDDWCIPLIRSFFPGRMLNLVDVDMKSLAGDAFDLVKRIHGAGVVTRDLKYDNFVYGKDGLSFVDFSQGCLDDMKEFEKAKEAELEELYRLF